MTNYEDFLEYIIINAALSFRKLEKRSRNCTAGQPDDYIAMKYTNGQIALIKFERLRLFAPKLSTQVDSLIDLAHSFHQLVLKTRDLNDIFRSFKNML